MSSDSKPERKTANVGKDPRRHMVSLGYGDLIVHWNSHIKSDYLELHD